MPIRHDPANGRFMPRDGAGARKTKRKFSSVPSRYGKADPLYGNEYPELPTVSEGKAGGHQQVSGHTLPANRIVPPMGKAGPGRPHSGYVKGSKDDPHANSRVQPRKTATAANRRARDNPFVNTQPSPRARARVQVAATRRGPKVPLNDEYTALTSMVRRKRK